MTTTTDKTGKIAMVTGGSAGIGLASARALAEQGYTVIITGRNGERLKSALAEMPAGKVHAIAADVTDPAAVDRLFSEVEQRFGRLDVLFNNAGMNVKPDSVEDITFEDWQTILQTNVTGVFLCLQAAVRLMKKQTPRGGRIINNGSVSASVPRYFAVPYTATKHAVTGITKAASLDCREFDIAVCQIDIGNAATKMTTRMGTTGALQADGSVKQEPTMDVENVAATICYMAGLPLEANPLFLTVLATKMPFSGRG
ncbi:MAG: SDR family oxidoreductase [Methylobacteriaceae bacterium]|jgi:NAD(P)-dependent dehydrogenase (short-subunit alcohol dehydrogenase family)|nr:SDR family oxidoreductase [Methylobacteriaceae bacterium]